MSTSRRRWRRFKRAPVMDEVPGPDWESFETIITNVMVNPDEASLIFSMMIQKDPDIALKLATSLGSVHNTDSREFLVALLSGLLTNENLGTNWRNLCVSTQSTIKCSLLDRIMLEESKSIITRLCGIVSDLAASLLPDNNWPELLPFLNQCLTDSTSNNCLKQSAFLLYAQLADKMGETVVSCVKNLHSLFLDTLNSDDTLHNLDVRIAEAKSLEEETRHLAVEFMLTLVEAREKVPGMMKKVPLFTNTCFAILLNLLLDIKDEPRWHSAEPSWQSDEPSWHCAEKQHEVSGATKSCSFGMSCLKRFSIALGGQTTTPIAIEQLSAYLVAPEWEKRHAALLAIVQISEGSSKMMIRYLEQFVNMVLLSSQDPHPRVRWAAIQAIHQLLVDFCPYLQEQYHSQILPALAAALDDLQNPRVQAFAAAAVVIFCQSKKSETIEPYIDGILKKLVVLLQNDNQMVQQEAFSALGAIADLSKEHFHKYYDFVMSYLKTLLINANDKSD